MTDSMQHKVLLAVAVAAALGSPPLWISALASEEVDSHNDDMSAHYEKHKESEDKISGVKQEVTEVKAELKYVKTRLGNIESKLDILIERESQ